VRERPDVFGTSHSNLCRRRADRSACRLCQKSGAPMTNAPQFTSGRLQLLWTRQSGRKSEDCSQGDVIGGREAARIRNPVEIPVTGLNHLFWQAPCLVAIEGTEVEQRAVQPDPEKRPACDRGQSPKISIAGLQYL